MTDKDKNIDESEIDLLEIAGKLWAKRKFIIKCSFIGLVVGIVIAFSIPKEYTTSVILTSESGKTVGGSMGALASMAGINLGGMTSGSEMFSPELYPEVLNSTPFVYGLLNINVIDTKQNINTSLYNYMKDEQKSAWWNYILKSPSLLIGLFASNDDTLAPNSSDKNDRFISKEDMSIIEAIKSSYSLSTDKKTGVTTINVTMQSPQISAYLADTLTSYLQTYIIDKRTQKARVDLENTERLYKNAKNDYDAAQYKLASFMDGNINLVSERAKTNKEKLQNETNLAYSVYTQMAQQVQMNKIKIQDDTPVFTIIQPAVEPLFPEKPKRKIVIIVILFVSFVGGLIWVIKKDLWDMFRNSNQP